MVAALVALGSGGVAAAQLPVPQPRPAGEGQRPREDTIPVPQFRVPPPVSPLGAAVRSLVLPGWGQSLLDRRTTGAIFIFWEGVTLTMTLKSLRQLEYQERIGAATVEGKRQEVEDWAVLLIFNHLMAAAEAFVAAQLWDFPPELRADLKMTPDGRLALGLRAGF